MMLGWLLRPKVCKYVCVASLLVGLICSALTSSLNILRKLIWWKILIYILLSFFICSFLLFVKAKLRSIPLWLKAHFKFFALIASIIYSLVFDTVVHVKPDAYSAISCASFSITCLCWSKLTDLGFETELLSAFCADLIIQLWKIEHWLVIIGVCFIYFLVVISRLPLVTPEGGLPVQDRNRVAVQSSSNSEVVRGSTLSLPVQDQSQVAVQSSSLLSPAFLSDGDDDNTSLLVPAFLSDGDDDITSLLGPAFFSDDSIVSLSNSPSHEENLYRYLIRQLKDCIDDFEEKNESLVDMVSRHIEAMVDAKSRGREAMADANLVRDALKSGIDRLRETVEQIIANGMKEECFNAYSEWRGEFLEQCLLKPGLQSKFKEDAVKTWKAASDILFLIEERLCYFVFPGSATWVLPKVREELKFRTLIVAYSILTTEDCFQEDLSLKPIIPNISKLLAFMSEVGDRNEQFRHTLREFTGALHALEKISNCNTDQATVAGGGVHEITQQLTTKIKQFYTSSAVLRNSVMLVSRVGGFPISLPITDIIERLERNLAAISKDYKDPALGYVFMMNNLRYIGDALISIEGLPEAGDDWFRQNTEKVEQNCKLYQSSWNEIVKILKLERGESMKLERDESMKKRLKQMLKDFNREFYETCNRQSTWTIHGKQLREQIIKSIDDIMVLPYGLFINRFRDVFGNDKDASDCIRYGIVEIQSDISNLFLLSE